MLSGERRRHSCSRDSSHIPYHTYSLGTLGLFIERHRQHKNIPHRDSNTIILLSKKQKWLQLVFPFLTPLLIPCIHTYIYIYIYTSLNPSTPHKTNTPPTHLDNHSPLRLRQHTRALRIPRLRSMCRSRQ